MTGGPASRLGAAPYLYLAPSVLVLGVFFFGSFAQVIQYAFGVGIPFEQTYTVTGLTTLSGCLATSGFGGVWGTRSRTCW